MKRKLPALLLAILLMLCTVTAVVLTGGASGEDTFDPDTYDYDALYIEGAVFSWHAFDKKEGDALPTDGVLADLSNGTKLTVSKTNANATIAYGDGYLKLWGDTKLVLANAYRQPSTGSSINYTVEYSYATVDVPSAGITDPADTAKNGGALPSWRSGERFFTSKKIDSAVSTDLVRLHATKVAGLESQRLWRNAYNLAVSSPASRSAWTGGDNILSSDFTYLQGKETEDGVAAGTYCYLSDKELMRDGFQMSYGLGRYIASLTFIKALAGVDIDRVSWMPDGVTEEECRIAIAAANAAVATPFETTAI